MIGSGSTISTEYILKFESISKGEAGVVQNIDVDVDVKGSRVSPCHASLIVGVPIRSISRFFSLGSGDTRRGE
jgi:hypothetical protein